MKHILYYPLLIATLATAPFLSCMEDSKHDESGAAAPAPASRRYSPAESIARALMVAYKNNTRSSAGAKASSLWTKMRKAEKNAWQAALEYLADRESTFEHIRRASLPKGCLSHGPEEPHDNDARADGSVLDAALIAAAPEAIREDVRAILGHLNTLCEKAAQTARNAASRSHRETSDADSEEDSSGAEIEEDEYDRYCNRLEESEEEEDRGSEADTSDEDTQMWNAYAWDQMQR